MKNIKYLLFVLLCIIMPLGVSAEEVEYTLYDSNIKVNTNRTLNVEEQYKIYFIENTKLITRKLNEKLIVTRPDKTKTMIDGKITNIKSDVESNVETKNSAKNISLKVSGSQDETNDYNIQYKYNLGNDSLKNGDELYYDIVNDVDAIISNVTFTITLPSNIDEKNIYFLIDNKYVDEEVISYEVNDNVITGELNISLEKNQKLSVYIKFNNNYFKGTTDNFNYFNFLSLIFPVISLIMMSIFFIRYGKGNKLKIVRKKDIPNNFDSAEIGYLYKGKLEEKDLTTVLLYLANEGYLRIVEHDDGYKLGKENSFRFEKLKDYDRNNAAQELIFNELFRNRDVANLSDIEYHFADTFKEAKNMLNNEDNHKKLFFKNLDTIKLISLITILLSVLSVYLNPLHIFTNNYLFVLPLIGLIVLGLYIIYISNASGIMKFIIGGALLIGVSYVSVTAIMIQLKLLIIFAIGLALILIICGLYTRLSERTKFGNKVLSETYGLKYYLETLSKQELEQNISDNNNYFYEMIPYAYVLDSIDIWMKKGRNIITNPPSWYIPSTEFNMNNFEQFIQNVIYTTTLVMMKHVYSESELVQYENTKVKTNLND